MNRDHDSQLALAAVNDPAAFNELYLRNNDMLLTYFGRRVSCPHTSADLAGDVWIEAWRTIDRFDPTRGPARAWLCGIAANQLRRWAAATARHNRAVPAWAAGAGDIAGDDSSTYGRVDERVDLATLAPALIEALRRLSPPVRSAIVLRYVDELDYRSIAERLSCSAGAARVRVSRGLTQLEQHMETIVDGT